MNQYLNLGRNHITNMYRESCCKFGSALYAPTRNQSQTVLFLVGIGLLTAGLSTDAAAQMTAKYNDLRIANSVNALLTYIEGSFGALVMVSAGIGAILSSAFGQYRASLGLLVVAVGSFILRSVLSTFLNDDSIRG